MRNTFLGKTTLVIGSAPGRKPPLPHDGPVVCVNGSQGGLALTPTLTVIGGHTMRQASPVARETLHSLSGKSTGCVCFVDVGRSETDAKAMLSEVSFRWEEWITLSAVGRASIVEEACGLRLSTEDEKPSNGVLAIALPLAYGARKTIASGFSLGGGHFNLRQATPRKHLPGDTKFFQITQTRGLVQYIEPEMRERFGAPS